MADPADGGGATVLVLEDDPGIAKLERLRLQRAGYAVEVATTAEDAWQRVEQGGVDLLVLDHRLGGSDHGLDLYLRLRDAGLTVPSVLVTGFGDEALLTRALRAGVRDFIPKTPDYLDYLVPAVDRVMAQVQTERQLDEERARRASEEAARAEAEAQRAALAESEERFRVLTQAIPQLVCSCRADGSLDFCNDQWSEYTGQSPAQAYGSGWLDAVHPDDRPAVAAAWGRAVATGTDVQTSYRLRRGADGAYRWHLARAWPQKDDAGRAVRWFGTCTDIDDQKKAEDALVLADRRKDAFIAMLAHELRNPLAAINNAVALSRLAEGEAERAWTAGVIERQVGNLTRLIDDLLDVSRVRTGKLQLRTRRVDAAEVVRSAVDAVRPFIESRRHELTVAIEPGPHPVMADPTRLEQVVVNLLTNAAKYTDEGGRLSLRAGTEVNEFVVRVRDSGVGIRPEMLSRVFDLFTQVEGEHDRAQGGLGIGLTLVRTLVAMHGGTVSAASDGPGAGSEFTVRIPAASGAAVPAPHQARTPYPGAGATRRRVLVVDDDGDSARGMARLLRASGHETWTAADGRSALESARAHRPDVALIDVRLPDIDGRELARQLRAEPGLEGLLLVAVSGLGREEDREQSLAAGFDHHLVKPVDLDALLALVASPDPAAATGRG
jgi:PAS domain S-box-containing protein